MLEEFSRRGRRLRRLRRLVQSLILLIFVVSLWRLSAPGEWLVNPALFFQADPLAMLATAVAERTWLPGLGLTCGVILATLVLGRVWCGWLCPLGTALDGWAGLTRRLRRNPLREDEPGRASRLKYWLLAGIGAAAVGGVQLAFIFDPLAIAVRTLSFILNPLVNGGAESFFGWLIPATDYDARLEAIYRALHDSVFATVTPVFPHTGLILLVALLVFALALLRRRYWCRNLCPLGALLALASRAPRLRRVVGKCRAECDACRDRCRMNAIRGDRSYRPAECVLCWDCAADCPGETGFAFRRPAAAPAPAETGLSRRRVLEYLLGGVAVAVVARAGGQPPAAVAPLRPPGALPEPAFVERCIRCGNCMQVCITNVLQPSLFDTGAGGVWTPRLDLAIGYCEYQCTLCGEVCPTGAIRRLTVAEKKALVIGLAEINRAHCIPFIADESCLVCEEHCPTSPKAIVTTAGLGRARAPVIVPERCIGCGICVTRCPARVKGAIRVRPV